jgi:hypothetical protein
VPSQSAILAPPYRVKVPLEDFIYSLHLQSYSSVLQEIIVVKSSSIDIFFNFIFNISFDFLRINQIIDPSVEINWFFNIGNKSFTFSTFYNCKIR